MMPGILRSQVAQAVSPGGVPVSFVSPRDRRRELGAGTADLCR
jgi:hypothetical protein